MKKFEPILVHGRDSFRIMELHAPCLVARAVRSQIIVIESDSIHANRAMYTPTLSTIINVDEPSTYEPVIEVEPITKLPRLLNRKERRALAAKRRAK